MIAAIIPAAGRSLRMGQPKLLLKLGGQTILYSVVTSLRQGGAERVIVVVPPVGEPEGPALASEASRAGGEVLAPATRPAEMRASVELAIQVLALAPPDMVLLAPGDSPGITADLVARLVDHAARSPGRIIIPVHQGRRGHPVVLPWDLASQVPGLPALLGINALVARHQDRTVEVAVDNPEVVADLDTPDDLKRWRLGPLRNDDPHHADLDRSPPMMDKIQVSVRLFALAKERAGCSELVLELPATATAATVRAALRERLPDLEGLWSRSMIAVDQEYASDEAVIPPGSQVSVIPPVSGGAGA
jgi:molybdenum cofactor cytidylyltransferase